MEYKQIMKQWRSRAVQIKKMRESGMTFAAIGAKLGISKQMAQSIHKRMNHD